MNVKLVRVALRSIASAEAFAQDAGTLDKAKASGVDVMGVSESSVPLSCVLGSDKFVGYHVELRERILSVLLTKAAIRYATVTSAN